jgi:hypothetical protein
LYRDNCDGSVYYPHEGAQDAPIGEFVLDTEQEREEGSEEAGEGFITLELFNNNIMFRERESVRASER